MTSKVLGRSGTPDAVAVSGASDPRRCQLMIASDLDRTLIYSASALQLPTADEDSPTLVSVEILDGRPHSFITFDAARRLADLARRATFVPITTRTVAQYQRVHFPDVRPAYAITSNGGNILLEGVPDAGWSRATDLAIAACDVTLAEVKHELSMRTAEGWAIKRRSGDGLFCYVVVEPSATPAEFVPDWSSWCVQRGWRVSVQGRKIYAIPHPLTKERAMAAVAERLGGPRVIAAGDGALDAGFLSAADAAIRPPHGELADVDWQHDNVQVGPRAGVLAADDILAWFEADLKAGEPGGRPDQLAASVSA